MHNGLVNGIPTTPIRTCKIEKWVNNVQWIGKRHPYDTDPIERDMMDRIYHAYFSRHPILHSLNGHVGTPFTSPLAPSLPLGTIHPSSPKKCQGERCRNERT
jgi:hypothetical protein